MSKNKQTLWERTFADYARTRPSQLLLHKNNLATEFGSKARPKRLKRPTEPIVGLPSGLYSRIKRELGYKDRKH